MVANGDTKYPPWLVAEMGDELGIISDAELCRKMGWTFTELDAQPFFAVSVAQRWFDTQAKGENIRRERQSKKRKRGGSRKSRRKR